MINKKRFFAALAISAALITAGCAGQNNGTQTEAAQTEAAQSAESSAEAEAPAEEQAGAAVQESEYKSTDGWSVRYDPSVIEVTEEDGVTFRYTGAADGVNQINVKYYGEQMPDEVLYNAMAGADGLPEHSRSEGYFAGRTDVWSIRTEMASEAAPNARDSFIAVERNGGTLLIKVTTSEQAGEETGMAVSDTLAAVIDSFELADQQPQTYSAHVPGRYEQTVTDEIEGQKESTSYSVQLNEDHTGVISLQDEIPVIWYSREGKILDASTGEQIYEYVIEGDSLYLTPAGGGDAMDFMRVSAGGDASAASTAAETADAREAVDYSDMNNWVYWETGEDKDADLFLVAPTVDTLDEEYMSLDNDVMKGYFKGALNMERGIYEDSARMFAPYYRQMALTGYKLDDPAERERRLQTAYKDVSDAFQYYMANENGGRPIILAGFSQGADMCYRLLEEYFGEKDMQDRLIAVYAIGWACTDEMVQKYPQIVPAKSADDLGTVISFDCEAEEITETIVNPAGQKAHSINPLNWKTDGTPAEKSENLGACFTDYSGGIKTEEAQLCGCYIDEERGALKVTDISKETYPAKLDIFPEGAYHIYDYQFFFRNLQENVQHRVELYMEQAAAAENAA